MGRSVSRGGFAPCRRLSTSHCQSLAARPRSAHHLIRCCDARGAYHIFRLPNGQAPARIVGGAVGSRAPLRSSFRCTAEVDDETHTFNSEASMFDFQGNLATSLADLRIAHSLPVQYATGQDSMARLASCGSMVRPPCPDLARSMP